MPTAVLYARYSTANQDPLTIDVQLRVNDEYADRRGILVLDRFSDEEKSGQLLIARAGMQRLLARLDRRDVDIVIVTDADRLSRDEEHMHRIVKKMRHLGIALHSSHAGGVVDPLIMSVKAAMSAELLRNIARKTWEGQREHHQRKKAVAGLAYGYDVLIKHDEAGDRVPGLRKINEEQGKVILRIFEAYAAGRSPVSIAAELNEDGILGPNGSLWRDTTIRGSRARETGILNNRSYLGRSVWNKQRYSIHPETEKRIARPNPQSEWQVVDVPEWQIVDEDLWDRVKARQDAEKMNVAKVRSGNRLNAAHRPQYILSHKIVCGVCGGPYAIMAKDRYGCTNHRKHLGCDNTRTIQRQRLEEEVIGVFPAALLTRDSVKDIERRMAEAMKAQTAGRTRADIEQDIRTIDQQIRRLVDAIENGGVSVRALTARLQELELEQKALADEHGSKSDNDAVPQPRSVTNLSTLRISAQAMAVAGREAPDSPWGRKWFELFRTLVERVIVTPIAGSKEISIEVEGQIASILVHLEAWRREERRIRSGLSTDFARLKSGKGLHTVEDRMRFIKSMEEVLEKKRRSWERLQLTVVAGTGFEPVTFRL